MAPRRPAGPPPDARTLHEAALAHLSRFAATEAGLVAVLDRRIARWARAAEADPEQVAAAVAAAREAARAVARRLVAAGAVDDAAFAEARARRLARAGRSRRAIAAHLAAKGVKAEEAGGVLPEDDLPAALALVRRRRFGAFGPPADAEQHRRQLAALARAGFGAAVAAAALDMPAAEAEAVLAARA